MTLWQGIKMQMRFGGLLGLVTMVATVALAAVPASAQQTIKIGMTSALTGP